MKQLIIEELKKCASVRGKQKTWVSELDDERLYQIFIMLKNGSSSRIIAEYVREVWGLNKESSVHSLSRGVQKFNKRIEHLWVNDSPPACKAETDSSIDDDEIDVLEQNQKIADQLRARIEKMMREEKEQGISYPNLMKDVQALTSLEKAILKEADWRLKNKGQLIEEYEERREKLIGDRFDKLIEKCLPTDEDREMFVKFLNTFMGLVEEKAFLLETVMIDGKETYKRID